MKNDNDHKKQTLRERMATYIKAQWEQFMDGPKWGQTTLGGFGRQGLAEVRAAIYPESNIAQPTDYGIWGRATPGETAELRRDDGLGRDAEEERKIEPLKVDAPQVGIEQSPSQSSRLMQQVKEITARDSHEPNREDRELDR